MTPQGAVRLKEGRDKKIRNHYPWVQKEEVAQTIDVQNGQLTTLLDHEGNFLAIGTYNAQSRFPVKVLTLQKESVDETFFLNRIKAAKTRRKSLLDHTNAYRLLFAEADGLPGLIVDQYADHLVTQVRSLGMETLAPLWLPALAEVSQAKSILERSDMAGRAEEGLPETVRPLHGETPDIVSINEDGLRLDIPVRTGLKTGYYLDQRNSRRRLADLVRPGDKVLDCFCYSGGFALHASRAGAHAVGVDIHEVALETARNNACLNNLEIPFVQANAFEFLESGADALGPFDWIILDPPAIAKTESKRDSLKWAIWNLVHRALPLLKPGGTLLVCNCSYQLTLENTLKTCRLAASDVGDQLYLDAVTFQDIDHPAPLAFPEALYLKCLWLRKA